MAQVIGIFSMKMLSLFHISRFLLLLTLFKFFQYSASSLSNDKRWYNLVTIFKSLHDSGCCEDRVECREKNGDRIFRSVDSSAAFPDPREETNAVVHSLIFGQLFAAHINISVETLSPVFRALAFTQDMGGYDPDALLRYSPVPNGCSVRAWMVYKDEHIVVCRGTKGDQVYMKESWNSRNWNFINGCLRGGSGHPAMCEQNLIDLLAIPGPNGKTTVVAYIDKLEGMDVHGKRVIEVKVWEDEIVQGKPEKYESRLASIYWYRIDGNIAHGIYFTTNAFVCKFEFELGKGDLKAERFQFDKDQQKLCRPMSVYLECPQGWCYELGMTTSFTIKGKDGFYYVYFTKSLYHWRVKTRKIPMSVPRVEDALYYGSARQYIWNEGQRYQGIDKEAPYPPIMIFDATAAFRIEHKGEFYTFSYHPLPSNGWNSVPDRDSRMRSLGTLATNWRGIYYIKLELFDGIRPEAAYFDDNERKLYLFEGSQYTVFQVKETAEDIAMNNSWKHFEGPKSVKDLNFEEGDEIKEVIALGDNLSFVINATHFYHSVGKIYKSGKELKFSFTELFRVQSECYYNDYREYKKTLAMYGVQIPEETVSQRKYDAQYVQIGEPSSIWGISTILAIIGIGAAIALAALLAMFLFGRVRRRTETKIVKKYSSKMSGIEDRKLSKEPISKTSPLKERRLSKEPSKFKFSKLKMRKQR